jgi:hypothetical protein
MSDTKPINSLFPETDKTNADYLSWVEDNKDIYKGVALPVNVLANKWIFLEDQRLGIMTDEKFQISKFSEMVEANEEYLIKMIKEKNIMNLVIDVQRLIETIVWANVREGEYALEARIRKEINNYEGLYFTLTKHISNQSKYKVNYEHSFIELLNKYNINW